MEDKLREAWQICIWSSFSHFTIDNWLLSDTYKVYYHI
jgi:hypothetical protein